MSDRETILTRAADLIGNRARAETWMLEPIVDYAGHTPEDLMLAGQGEAVMAYLGDLQRGATG